MSSNLFNDKLEEAIIGELFLAPEKISAIEDIICPADFSAKSHAEIFEAMQALNSKKLAIDIQTVNQEIKKNNDFEISIDDLKEYIDATTTSANLFSHCNQLKTLSDKRNAYNALKKAESSLESGQEIQSIFDYLEAARPTDREEEYRNYDDNSLLNKLIEFATNEDKPTITPTGFKNLDKCLSGGLTEGTYIISAIPGMGKTAFASQMLDSIAKNGSDVILFNYEMSTSELLSRSIARIAYKEERAAAPQANEIYLKKLLIEPDNEAINEKKEREKKLEILFDAEEKYSETAKNLYYVNCDSDYTVNNIKRRVKRHIAARNKRPVIAVDYLQIMPAQNPKQINITEIVSANMSELKRISREFKIPVIIISATSRENYNKVAGLSAFKNSGVAEYTADFGAVLYYTALENKTAEELTQEEKEDITLKIVKSRRKGKEFADKLEFTFKGAWAYYEEKEKANKYFCNSYC